MDCCANEAAREEAEELVVIVRYRVRDGGSRNGGISGTGEGEEEERV